MPREIGLGWLKGKGVKVLDSSMYESYALIASTTCCIVRTRDKHKNDLSKSESISDDHRKYMLSFEKCY